MKYTSLSHWNTGHNVQQNWNSVEEWQDYCKEDSSVVWSKLFKPVDGELIGEYPEKLPAEVPADCLSPTVASSRRYGQPTARHMQSPAMTGVNEYGLDMGYLAEKLNILLRDISRHTPSEAARGN